VKRLGSAFVKVLTACSDMLEVATKLVDKFGSLLTPEERNAVSTAFKNNVSQLRAASRIITSIEEKERASGHHEHANVTSGARVEIEEILEKSCRQVLDIARRLTTGASGEDEVFYFKMAADYSRYLSEFLSSGKNDALHEAQQNYQKCMDLADDRLPFAHPLRLGGILNYSVFQYEIENKKKNAITTATRGFELGIQGLESLSEELYSDAALLLQLLRDNLAQWSKEESQTVQL